MSMNQPIRCQYCGANLGPADLDQPACPYCKTTHPHVAQARQQVEGLRQVFGQGGLPGMMGMGMAPPGSPPSPWQSGAAPNFPPPSPWQGMPGPPPHPPGAGHTVVNVVVVVSVVVALAAGLLGMVVAFVFA